MIFIDFFGIWFELGGILGIACRIHFGEGALFGARRSEVFTGALVGFGGGFFVLWFVFWWVWRVGWRVKKVERNLVSDESTSRIP